MKQHLRQKDLSAYLDGEHARPEAVRRHLQQCADCAREHVELQKLSANVKALPDCELTFDFTDRVMRSIESKQAERRSRPRYWLPAGVALAASLAVIVSISSLQDRPSSSVEPASIGAAEPAPVIRIDFAGMLGPDGSERDAMGGYPDVAGDMQIAYASEVATRPVPQEFFTGAGYNEGLVALNASEKETLFQLLGSTLIDEQMM